jgi:hypothetical protein
MLDDMTAEFLAGDAAGERWLTLDDGGPVALAYYAPERMTDGTFNCSLSPWPLTGMGRASARS